MRSKDDLLLMEHMRKCDVALLRGILEMDREHSCLNALVRRELSFRSKGDWDGSGSVEEKVGAADGAAGGA